LIYVDGKKDHKIGKDNMVDHLESLIRDKIAIKEQTEKYFIAKQS
jgi:(E)-4-hydroxy-3-methylbut-2-enyl-diphosphate synthase